MFEQPTWQQILARPFPAQDITFRVGFKRGGNYEVLTYLDARQVAARLSEVDPAWNVDFSDPTVERLGYSESRGKGDYKKDVEQVRVHVSASITLRPSDDVIARREDTGETIGDINDENIVKTAYSDALKRAAVHFGIGAYIYSLRGKIGPVSPDDVNYGRISGTADAQLRRQYAAAIGSLTLSEEQLAPLRKILQAAGKYDEKAEAWLVQQPASAFEQIVVRAAENLSPIALLENSFQAEKV